MPIGAFHLQLQGAETWILSITGFDSTYYSLAGQPSSEGSCFIRPTAEEDDVTNSTRSGWRGHVMFFMSFALFKCLTWGEHVTQIKIASPKSQDKYLLYACRALVFEYCFHLNTMEVIGLKFVVLRAMKKSTATSPPCKECPSYFG